MPGNRNLKRFKRSFCRFSPETGKKVIQMQEYRLRRVPAEFLLCACRYTFRNKNCLNNKKWIGFRTISVFLRR